MAGDGLLLAHSKQMSARIKDSVSLLSLPLATRSNKDKMEQQKWSYPCPLDFDIQASGGRCRGILKRDTDPFLS